MVQMQKLRDYLARTRGKRYPFPGHRLADKDNYVKNLYLKHLSMLLCCGKDVSEEQTLFLQRLIAGCGGEYSLETYMRQGQQATPETLEELLGQLESGGLRDPFLMDALLLLHLGPQEEEREELLAALCEAAQIKLPELEALTRLCAKVLRLELCNCILTEFEEIRLIQEGLWKPYFPDTVTPEWKNSDGCLIAAAGKPVRCDIAAAIPLTSMLISGPDKDLEFNVIFNYDKNGMVAEDYFDCTTNMYQNGFEFFKKKRVIYFYNLKISLDVFFWFKDVKRVCFVNCEFTGCGKKTGIWFEKCVRVDIIGCTFRGFETFAIHAAECKELQIVNSTFIDCFIEYNHSHKDWRSWGGVIHVTNNSIPVTLQNSTFKNCGGFNKKCYYESSIICNGTMSIYNCRFENCWCFHTNKMTKDPSHAKRCLFRTIVREYGNDLIDSAELGPH